MKGFACVNLAASCDDRIEGAYVVCIGLFLPHQMWPEIESSGMFFCTAAQSSFLLEVFVLFSR